MKYILFLFIVINVNILVSQEKVIALEYGLTLEPEKDLFKDNPMLKQLLNESVANAKNEKFTLLINKEGSKFFHNSSLNLNDKNYTPLMSNYQGETYSLNNDIYIKSLLLGNNIFIKKEKVKNWVITTETKLIDNYKCFKATNTFQVISPNKVFNHPVIAWFCPDLPYNYGPNGYSNLPGLILQLQEFNAIYGVKKISFNSEENFSFNELKNIKTLTQEEADKILDDQMRG